LRSSFVDRQGMSATPVARSLDSRHHNYFA